jgi:hypothetical protein
MTANSKTNKLSNLILYNGCFFKFGVEVGVELSIVNAPYRLRMSCLNLTLLHEWCALNRLFNAYFDAKFKKTSFSLYESNFSSPDAKFTFRITFFFKLTRSNNVRINLTVLMQFDCVDASLCLRRFSTCTSYHTR